MESFFYWKDTMAFGAAEISSHDSKRRQEKLEIDRERKHWEQMVSRTKILNRGLCGIIWQKHETIFFALLNENRK